MKGGTWVDRGLYESYVAILEHELVPALGCTEPIAIAYASARARKVLGCFPEHITARLSGNIIKNVKSVIVPNSRGHRGIETAAVLGCVGGDADLQLAVLQRVTDADIARAQELVQAGLCSTEYEEGRDNLYICIEMTAGDRSASVTVEYEHTNITRVEKDGKEIYRAETAKSDQPAVDKSLLSVRGILDFANELALDDVRPTLRRQIDLNTAISEEGLGSATKQ